LILFLLFRSSLYYNRKNLTYERLIPFSQYHSIYPWLLQVKTLPMRDK